MAQRLLDAYHKAVIDEENSALRRKDKDIWTEVLGSELYNLIEIVEEKNAKKLADYLINFGSGYIMFGGVTTSVDLFTTIYEQNYVALTYLDKLVSLADALGLIPYEMPLSPQSGNNMRVSIDELVDKIENYLSISISPPAGVIYTDGIVSSKGIFHYRHLNAIYSASRIQALNPNKKPCCEYGGGIGIAAMYARRMGIMDYTLYDLPITCLLAGHYLLHSVGLESVNLYGEPAQENTIKVLPYWEPINAKNNQFYLTINQDSFPEISRSLVEEYLLQIKRTTRKYFLSINHEGFYPKTVNLLAEQINGFKRISRSKYWIREGYLEELFRLQSE